MRLLLTALLLLTLAPVIKSGDFVSGSAACPSSGNARVSTTIYSLYQLTVSAPSANTGNIFLGGSNVNTTTGGIVVPGASANFNKPSAGISPNTLYFACSVNTDTLQWIGTR